MNKGATTYSKTSSCPRADKPAVEGRMMAIRKYVVAASWDVENREDVIDNMIRDHRIDDVAQYIHDSMIEHNFTNEERAELSFRLDCFSSFREKLSLVNKKINFIERPVPK